MSHLKITGAIYVVFYLLKSWGNNRTKDPELRPYTYIG